MGRCLILKAGSPSNDEALTATPEYVRTGKKFIGKNGSESTGTLNDITAQTVELAIGGTYNIPSGIHTGNGKVPQNITTMDGGTVYPSVNQQVVRTANKYMKSDVYIAALTGLTPGNIKKDVVIEIESDGKKIRIVGTYEGYT